MWRLLPLELDRSFSIMARISFKRRSDTHIFMVSFRLSLSVSLLRKFHCANLLSPILMQGRRASQREWKALGVPLSRMRAASKSVNCSGIGLENISKKAVLNSSRILSLSGLNVNRCSCSRVRALILLAHVGALVRGGVKKKNWYFWVGPTTKWPPPPPPPVVVKVPIFFCRKFFLCLESPETEK